MATVLSGVIVTLDVFNEKQERGYAQTSDGMSVTINASRFRAAGLARRNQSRIHILDPKVKPGLRLVVDIEKTGVRFGKVTTIHQPRMTKRRPKGQLLVDTKGIGSVVRWFKEKSFGFIKVEKIFTDGQVVPAPKQIDNLFFHSSGVKSELLDTIKPGNTLFEFTVFRGADGRLQAKIIRQHADD